MPLSRPFSLYGYNSAEGDSYTMKEYARYDIQNRDYVDKDVVLYATLLLYYPIILGYPQLKKYNLKANQADSLQEFNDPYYLQNYNQTRHLT